MTDIAFAPDGRLFGMTFTGLYEIDPETAQATFIANHGVPGGNALVFQNDLVLLAAGSSSSSLYQVNLGGGSFALGDVGALSAGDLAFYGQELYLSSLSNQLIRIDLGPPATGTPVGPLGFANVYGLATGDDGVLYGVSGTQLFSIDPDTGMGTLEVDYAGQGLGAAYGSTFIGEAVPTCPDTPRPDCLVAAKAKLAIKEKKPGAEKFALALKGFSDATAQGDFGNPVDGVTRYDVCLFDGDGSSVVRLTVDRAGDSCGAGAKPCWKAKGVKGFAYKDPAAESSGVRKMASASGPVNKGKLAVAAGNKAPKGQTALPHGLALRLAAESSVFVQVAASDALCYEATLDNVKKADGRQFKAKKP
jgi:hypothetical protein